MKDIQCSQFENLEPNDSEANARRLILGLAKASTSNLSDRRETVLTIAESIAKVLQPNSIQAPKK